MLTIRLIVVSLAFQQQNYRILGCKKIMSMEPLPPPSKKLMPRSAKDTVYIIKG